MRELQMAEREVEWYKTVVAEEMGYCGPPGDLVCPLRDWLQELRIFRRLEADPVPIPMLLWCPQCHAQHVDRPQPEKRWLNPPHRTHQCQSCGHLWRPANVPTVGVEKLP